MLKEQLKKKDYIPVLQRLDQRQASRENWEERRREMRSLLETYSYGITPVDPVRVTGTVKESGRSPTAGNCLEETVELTYTTGHGEGHFPLRIFLPEAFEKPPVLLHIAFGSAEEGQIPVEEIAEHGYALVVVEYRDMVNDNLHGDFSDGIAAHFRIPGERGSDAWGKIGMWAWGASRVLDYLEAERPDLDTAQTALIGHSRLGKTALWCGAQDTRFAAVIANNSGYGGAASSKHGTGERVTDFLRGGSWDWFCENFKQFTGAAEDEKPYDQSFLLALIAPRYLLIGSAEQDPGADPTAEFLTTLHASAAWELLGVRGLVTEDRMPVPGDFWGEGNILYHYRKGHHDLLPADWMAYVRFLDQKFRKR